MCLWCLYRTKEESPPEVRNVYESYLSENESSIINKTKNSIPKYINDYEDTWHLQMG